MSNPREKAKELLKHYFGVAGVDLYGSDCHIEIDEIVDCIIQAAVDGAVSTIDRIDAAMKGD